MNVFETSSQIVRIHKLIDQLECEISSALHSVVELSERIEQNEKSIRCFPEGRRNNRILLEINEMRREVFRCQRKIEKFQRKLSKNKFLLQSKLQTLPSSTSKPVAHSNQAIGQHFDWEKVLKFVN
jgi:hypothetical protein